MDIKNKNIVLAVTGTIASYKSCDIVRALIKEGANVDCILTENAKKFITPLTLQTLSKNKVYCDMFEEIDNWQIHHISLAKKADIVLVAPASADTIAKLAVGRACDLVCSTVLATKAKVFVCPTMNENMFNHKATQKNIETLKDYGCQIINAQYGELACGDKGIGRLAGVDVIIDAIKKAK